MGGTASREEAVEKSRMERGERQGKTAWKKETGKAAGGIGQTHSDCEGARFVVSHIFVVQCNLYRLNEI